MSRARRPHGFLLLETMLGVAIFAIGVLALARSMQHCLDAEIFRQQDQLARRVLENRMEEILAGAVQIPDAGDSTQLTGRFAGITLRQSREEFTLLDENKAQISGLETVTLQAVWKGPRGEIFKQVKFNRQRNE